LTNDIVASIV